MTHVRIQCSVCLKPGTAHNVDDRIQLLGTWMNVSDSKYGFMPVCGDYCFKIWEKARNDYDKGGKE